VEAGYKTSTVIPASRKRRQKGNPVVSDVTVMYCYESSATLTTGKLHYKLQTRQRGHPKTKRKAIVRQQKGKEKSGHGPQRGARLTVSHKINSTQLPEIGTML
jgi:hypothetical protein